ncbi:ABC transporter permease [Nitratireductor thuwali]|uniref:Glutathione transport system permease protein GsiD n=1 Tax=Nitratireductor thuwali TaxID=2267699 RepID=A0ABY5MCR8_9HYPH|nr:Glutathione transport system permease protein GsiD [Nitratireductor thuwali]
MVAVEAPSNMGKTRRAGTVGVALRLLLANPLGMLGLVTVVVIILAAVFAQWLAPYDPTRIMAGPRLAPPSLDHWLGTDQIGRDVFSRVLVGGQIALQVALASISAALTLGLALGLLAGFGPRWLDNIIMLLFDTVRSFPVVIFGLATVTVIGPSLATIILIVVVTSIPTFGRVARTQTMAMRNDEFILAERAMGAGTARILAVHVLPNIIGPLLILASMDIPVVITIEAGLSFLGVGVPPPAPSWGSILNDGFSFIRNTPWPVIAGGIPLILTTLAFTFLGEALRDIFDPKLRRDV